MDDPCENSHPLFFFSKKIISIGVIDLVRTQNIPKN